MVNPRFVSELVAKVCVDETEVLREVIPEPPTTVSHESPFVAEEEAISTLPLSPAPNPYQPVPSALPTIKAPVEVVI